MRVDPISVPVFPEEKLAADTVASLFEDLKKLGIEIKLGTVPDGQRPRLSKLPVGGVAALKTHRIDILRVLLARALVEEAHLIRQRWASTADVRTPEHGRRYAELMFSARAMLPPAYPWEAVTFRSYDGPVAWHHHLAFDRDGQDMPDAHAIDTNLAIALLEANKGEHRTPDAVLEYDPEDPDLE